MSLERHLIVFVKAPRRGRVKTRLARGIGAGAATAFYRRMTAALLRRLDAPRRWHLWLAVTPDADAGAKFWPMSISRFPQGGGDLGRRMQRAFDRLPPGPAVLIGSDIPDVRRGHVAAAFGALGDHDAVFGPASDGGYWLVGLRRRPRIADAFRRTRWSTRHALDDTLRNFAARRVAMIDELSDVDTPEDYWRWQSAQPALRFSCSRRRGNSSTKLQGRKR